MCCQSELESVHDLVAGAAAPVGAAIAACVIALDLNAGVLTVLAAAITIGIAAGILASAAAALGTADVMLSKWKNGGCASRKCEGAACDLIGYVASAAAGLLVTAYAAFALITPALLPFAGGLAMLIAVLGISLGFLATAGLRWDTAASLHVSGRPAPATQYISGSTAYRLAQCVFCSSRHSDPSTLPGRHHGTAGACTGHLHHPRCPDGG